MRKILLAYLLFPLFVRAQVDSAQHSHAAETGTAMLRNSWLTDAATLDKKRLAFALGSETVAATTSFVVLNSVWYSSYQHEKFHFFDDNKEWLGMDKCGHVITSFTLGKYGANALMWAGVKNKKAIWLGALQGMVYQSVLEIFDGYSSGWGFSKGDMLANAAGYLLFTTQYAFSDKIRINPKFGFYPSGYADYRPELLGETGMQQVLKDYNGQTYWLSLNIGLLSDKLPDWLSVAAGYGANGMTGGSSNPPYFNAATGNYETFARYSQFYISPDIDLSCIHTRSAFLHRVLSLFNFVKVPLPGLMMANGKLSAQLIAH